MATPAAPAYALTPIIVNWPGDEPDADAGAGSCDIGTGDCTLRAAIQVANTVADDVEIQFAIPDGSPGIRGDGVRVIEVGGVTSLPLPTITSGNLVTINGRSQGSGLNGSPLILIQPFSPGSPWDDVGLEVAVTTTTITGVAIGGFDVGISISSSIGSAVRGSYLGLDPGDTSLSPSFNPNGVGIEVLGAINTDIGGSTATDRNVISANGGDGIFVLLCSCPGQVTTIRGNYIGLNNLGDDARGNLGNGVHIKDSRDVTVGGLADGEGNVISGNGQDGVFIEGNNATENNQILGNLIGTNRTGDVAFGNQANGVSVIATGFTGPLSTKIGSAIPGSGNLISGNLQLGIYLQETEKTAIKGNLIGPPLPPTAPGALPNFFGVFVFDAIDTDLGGLTVPERNVISGNLSDGVSLLGVCGCGDDLTRIRGNYIGLNASGTAPLGNGENGVNVTFAEGVVVGGVQPGAGNVISGNTLDGVTVVGFDGFDSFEIDVFGNRIGTNPAGTAPMANGRDGVSLLPLDPTDINDFGPMETWVGSEQAGSGNLISGNTRHGVYVLRALEGPFIETLIGRNFIGTDAAGTGSIPNGGNGVLIEDSESVSVFENTIANNALSGVTMTPSVAYNPFVVDVGTTVTANSMFANQGLGIDFTPTVNPAGVGDGKSNHVPGGPTNHPVLASATTSPAGTVIGGSLNGTASSTFRVELFASPSCDPPGRGVSKSFLGALDVQTDAGGNRDFAATTVGIPAGQFITATSTNEKFQTSELSFCQVVTAAGIEVTAPPGGLVTTEAGGKATFTVKLATDPVADVVIGLSSSKPTEAIVSPASLTFSSGSGTVEQTVTVTGVPDSVADGNQAFVIVLAPAVSLDPAYSGMDGQDVNGLNQDGPALPTLSIQAAASVNEATGPNVPITFGVTLSPSSTQPVTVGWEVVDGSAQVGSDIVIGDRVGVLTFAAGETSKSIVLQVVGDAVVEGTETFTVRLVNATNAVIGAGTGTGTIIDNDQPPSACSPRPTIAMRSVRTGTDQLNVTVTAGSGTITKISFGSQAQPLQNALIETIGPAGIIQGFGTFTPPAGVTQQSFVVRRLAANQPVMVTLVIEDGCGPWTTFVGAGQSAF